jgi:D-alanyl-D-alanine carboxypeptidase/D-alanyl-D-alanine-endopeptidase (penicillin-binding protein 4)
MKVRSRISAAALLSFLLLAISPDLESAAPKKKKSTTKKKAAVTRKAPAKKKTAAPAPAVPVGATFEQRLASLVNSSVAASSTSSISVVEVETGRVIAQRNPHLPVAPASNMKLFTTAAAHDLLEQPFEFVTSVDIRGQVDNTGTLTGDVRIVGRGDPTIGSRFHDGNASAVAQRWAKKLKENGIKTIKGDLIFEYGYFDTEYVHPSWPADQLVNWYEAPIAALSMQEGCVMVRVKPTAPGQRAIVELEPKNNYMTVQNTCVTGGGRGVFVTRLQGTNTLIVKGNIPARSGNTEIFVTVLNPIHYFANATEVALRQNGIGILGSSKLVRKDARTDWRNIAQHRTPLEIVNYVINKKSQNHYAEQLLKAIGAETGRGGSFAGGSAAIHHWLTSKLGVPANEYTQIDGSGMSRFNRASSNAFIAVLRYMWKTPHRQEFLSSMPYTGETDSRLRRRLNQEPYARQVYAKTGYISGVIGLSGYVRGKSGKVYAFSFLFNGYRTGVWGVYRLQDEMLREIIRSG